jgi:hypothetical protein
MSLRLPIKGGARARVKGFTTFEVSAGFWRFFVSLLFATLVLLFQTFVFGDSLRFFGPPPTLASTVFQPKNSHDATTEEVQEEHSH